MQNNQSGVVGNYHELKKQARERRQQQYSQYRSALEAKEREVMTGSPEETTDPTVSAPTPQPSEDPVAPQVRRISSDVDPTPKAERELSRVKSTEDAATIISNIPPEVARKMQPQDHGIIQDDKELQRIIYDASEEEFSKVYAVTLGINPHKAAELRAARIRDIEGKIQMNVLTKKMIADMERQRAEHFYKPIFKANPDIDQGVIRDFAVQCANANPDLFEMVVRGNPAQVQKVRDWFVGQLQQRRHLWAAAPQPRESVQSGLTVAIKERKARRANAPKGSDVRRIGA